MKKLLALLVTVIYISSSIGATVHLHYCMDKLVNWSLSGKTDDKCENCGMEKNNGCCKDEQQFVKNNTDQKTAESAIHLLQISAIAATVPYINSNELYFSLIEKYPVSHPPPLISGIDILLLNCVFRI